MASGEQLASFDDLFGFAELIETPSTSKPAALPTADANQTLKRVEQDYGNATIKPAGEISVQNEIVVPIGVLDKSGKKKYKVLARQKVEDEAPVEETVKDEDSEEDCPPIKDLQYVGNNTWRGTYNRYTKNFIPTSSVRYCSDSGKVEISTEKIPKAQPVKAKGGKKLDTCDKKAGEPKKAKRVRKKKDSKQNVPKVKKNVEPGEEEKEKKNKKLSGTDERNKEQVDKCATSDEQTKTVEKCEEERQTNEASGEKMETDQICGNKTGTEARCEELTEAVEKCKLNVICEKQQVNSLSQQSRTENNVIDEEKNMEVDKMEENVCDLNRTIDENESTHEPDSNADHSMDDTPCVVAEGKEKVIGDYIEEIEHLKENCAHSRNEGEMCSSLIKNRESDSEVRKESGLSPCTEKLKKVPSHDNQSLIDSCSNASSGKNEECANLMAKQDIAQDINNEAGGSSEDQGITRRYSADDITDEEKLVLRQTSLDESKVKKLSMVYNPTLELRKSGRLKSSKCSSRYRGDYGIRAETYSKLISCVSRTSSDETNCDSEKDSETNESCSSCDMQAVDLMNSAIEKKRKLSRSKESLVLKKKLKVSGKVSRKKLKKQVQETNLQRSKAYTCPSNKTESEEENCEATHGEMIDGIVPLHASNRTDTNMITADSRTCCSILCACEGGKKKDSSSCNVCIGHDSVNCPRKNCDCDHHAQVNNSFLELKMKDSQVSVIQSCSSVQHSGDQSNIQCSSSEKKQTCDIQDTVPCRTETNHSCDNATTEHATSLNQSDSVVGQANENIQDSKALNLMETDSDSTELPEDFCLKILQPSDYVHSVGKSVNKKQNQLSERKLMQAELEKTNSESIESSPESSPTKDPVTVLEDLRMKLFEKAGATVKTVHKPKKFESKLISSRRRSIGNVATPASTSQISHIADRDSSATPPCTTKSGKSTPKDDSQSSGKEILIEVAKTLDIIQQVKRKADVQGTGKGTKPKRQRFQEKKFILRSMMKKSDTEIEDVEETIDLIPPQSVDNHGKEDLNAKDELSKTSEPCTKSDVDICAGEIKLKGNNHIDNEHGKTKDCDKETHNKSDPKHSKVPKCSKPKSVKCQACNHTFKTKELLRKHYPCRIRQTRTWSQNVLRPNRPFRRSEKKDEKFTCKLPKSAKNDHKNRPQLLKPRKTKFRRVKGKRRRRLYQLIHELKQQRKIVQWSHLAVNYETLSYKEQCMYKLGLSCRGNPAEGLQNYNTEDLSLFEAHRTRQREVERECLLPLSLQDDEDEEDEEKGRVQDKDIPAVESSCTLQAAVDSLLDQSMEDAQTSKSTELDDTQTTSGIDQSITEDTSSQLDSSYHETYIRHPTNEEVDTASISDTVDISDAVDSKLGNCSKMENREGSAEINIPVAVEVPLDTTDNELKTSETDAGGSSSHEIEPVPIQDNSLIDSGFNNNAQDQEVDTNISPEQEISEAEICQMPFSPDINDSTVTMSPLNKVEDEPHIEKVSNQIIEPDKQDTGIECSNYETVNDVTAIIDDLISISVSFTETNLQPDTKPQQIQQVVAGTSHIAENTDGIEIPVPESYAELSSDTSNTEIHEDDYVHEASSCFIGEQKLSKDMDMVTVDIPLTLDQSDSLQEENVPITTSTIESSTDSSEVVSNIEEITSTSPHEVHAAVEDISVVMGAPDENVIEENKQTDICSSEEKIKEDSSEETAHDNVPGSSQETSDAGNEMHVEKPINDKSLDHEVQTVIEDPPVRQLDAKFPVTGGNFQQPRQQSVQSSTNFSLYEDIIKKYQDNLQHEQELETALAHESPEKMKEDTNFQANEDLHASEVVSSAIPTELSPVQIVDYEECIVETHYTETTPVPSDNLQDDEVVIPSSPKYTETSNTNETGDPETSESEPKSTDTSNLDTSNDCVRKDGSDVVICYEQNGIMISENLLTGDKNIVPGTGISDAYESEFALSSQESDKQERVSSRLDSSTASKENLVENTSVESSDMNDSLLSSPNKSFGQDLDTSDSFTNDEPREIEKVRESKNSVIHYEENGVAVCEDLLTGEKMVVRRKQKQSSSQVLDVSSQSQPECNNTSSLESNEHTTDEDILEGNDQISLTARDYSNPSDATSGSLCASQEMHVNFPTDGHTIQGISQTQEVSENLEITRSDRYKEYPCLKSCVKLCGIAKVVLTKRDRQIAEEKMSQRVSLEEPHSEIQNGRKEVLRENKDMLNVKSIRKTECGDDFQAPLINMSESVAVNYIKEKYQTVASKESENIKHNDAGGWDSKCHIPSKKRRSQSVEEFITSEFLDNSRPKSHNGFHSCNSDVEEMRSSLETSLVDKQKDVSMSDISIPEESCFFQSNNNASFDFQLESYPSADRFMEPGTAVDKEMPPVLEKVGDMSQLEVTSDDTLFSEDSHLSSDDPPTLMPANEITETPENIPLEENIPLPGKENVKKDMTEAEKDTKKHKTERHFLDVLGDVCQTNDVLSNALNDSPKMSLDKPPEEDFLGRHFSDVIDNTVKCSRKPNLEDVYERRVTIAKLKEILKPGHRKEDVCTTETLFKLRSGIAHLLKKVEVPVKKDPAWLKRDFLKNLGRKKRKSLKHKSNNNISEKYKLNESDELFSDEREQSESNDEFADDESETSDMEDAARFTDESISKSNFQQADNNDKLTKGGISETILQMLTSIEDKGDVAVNLSNLLDVLAKNLGFSSKDNSMKLNEESSDSDSSFCYTESEVKKTNDEENELYTEKFHLSSDEDEPPCIDDIPFPEDSDLICNDDQLSECQVETQGKTPNTGLVDYSSSNESELDQHLSKSLIDSEDEEKNALDCELEKELSTESVRRAALQTAFANQDSHQGLDNNKTVKDTSEFCKVAPEDKGYEPNVTEVNEEFKDTSGNNNISTSQKNGEFISDQSKFNQQIDSDTCSNEKKEGNVKSLFQSITELNSIETDDDSNLESSYDDVSMSKRLSELKALTGDASDTDIKSDFSSISDTECEQVITTENNELNVLTRDVSDRDIKSDVSRTSDNEYEQEITTENNKLNEAFEDSNDKDNRSDISTISENEEEEITAKNTELSVLTDDISDTDIKSDISSISGNEDKSEITEEKSEPKSSTEDIHGEGTKSDCSSISDEVNDSEITAEKMDFTGTFTDTDIKSDISSVSDNEEGSEIAAEKTELKELTGGICDEDIKSDISSISKNYEEPEITEEICELKSLTGDVNNKDIKSDISGISENEEESEITEEKSELRFCTGDVSKEDMKSSLSGISENVGKPEITEEMTELQLLTCDASDKEFQSKISKKSDNEGKIENAAEDDSNIETKSDFSNISDNEYKPAEKAGVNLLTIDGNNTDVKTNNSNNSDNEEMTAEGAKVKSLTGDVSDKDSNVSNISDNEDKPEISTETAVEDAEVKSLTGNTSDTDTESDISNIPGDEDKSEINAEKPEMLKTGEIEKQETVSAQSNSAQPRQACLSSNNSLSPYQNIPEDDFYTRSKESPRRMDSSEIDEEDDLSSHKSTSPAVIKVMEFEDFIVTKVCDTSDESDAEESENEYTSETEDHFKKALDDISNLDYSVQQASPAESSAESISSEQIDDADEVVTEPPNSIEKGTTERSDDFTMKIGTAAETCRLKETNDMLKHNDVNKEEDINFPEEDTAVIIEETVLPSSLGKGESDNALNNDERIEDKPVRECKDHAHIEVLPGSGVDASEHVVDRSPSQNETNDEIFRATRIDTESIPIAVDQMENNTPMSALDTILNQSARKNVSESEAYSYAAIHEFEKNINGTHSDTNRSQLIGDSVFESKTDHIQHKVSEIKPKDIEEANSCTESIISTRNTESEDDADHELAVDIIEGSSNEIVASVTSDTTVNQSIEEEMEVENRNIEVAEMDKDTIPEATGCTNTTHSFEKIFDSENSHIHVAQMAENNFTEANICTNTSKSKEEDYFENEPVYTKVADDQMVEDITDTKSCMNTNQSIRDDVVDSDVDLIPNNQIENLEHIKEETVSEKNTCQEVKDDVLGDKTDSVPIPVDQELDSCEVASNTIGNKAAKDDVLESDSDHRPVALDEMEESIEAGAVSDTVLNKSAVDGIVDNVADILLEKVVDEVAADLMVESIITEEISDAFTSQQAGDFILDNQNVDDFVAVEEYASTETIGELSADDTGVTLENAENVSPTIPGVSETKNEHEGTEYSSHVKLLGEEINSQPDTSRGAENSEDAKPVTTADPVPQVDDASYGSMESGTSLVREENKNSKADSHGAELPETNEDVKTEEHDTMSEDEEVLHSHLDDLTPDQCDEKPDQQLSRGYNSKKEAENIYDQELSDGENSDATVGYDESSQDNNMNKAKDDFKVQKDACQISSLQFDDHSEKENVPSQEISNEIQEDFTGFPNIFFETIAEKVKRKQRERLLRQSRKVTKQTAHVAKQAAPVKEISIFRKSMLDTRLRQSSFSNENVKVPLKKKRKRCHSLPKEMKITPLLRDIRMGIRPCSVKLTKLSQSTIQKYLQPQECLKRPPIKLRIKLSEIIMPHSPYSPYTDSSMDEDAAEDSEMSTVYSDNQGPEVSNYETAKKQDDVEEPKSRAKSEDNAFQRLKPLKIKLNHVMGIPKSKSCDFKKDLGKEHVRKHKENKIECNDNSSIARQICQTDLHLSESDSDSDSDLRVEAPTVLGKEDVKETKNEVNKQSIENNTSSHAPWTEIKFQDSAFEKLPVKPVDNLIAALCDEENVTMFEEEQSHSTSETKSKDGLLGELSQQVEKLIDKQLDESVTAELSDEDIFCSNKASSGHIQMETNEAAMRLENETFEQKMDIATDVCASELYNYAEEVSDNVEICEAVHTLETVELGEATATSHLTMVDFKNMQALDKVPSLVKEGFNSGEIALCDNMNSYNSEDANMSSQRSDQDITNKYLFGIKEESQSSTAELIEEQVIEETVTEMTVDGEFVSCVTSYKSSEPTAQVAMDMHFPGLHNSSVVQLNESESGIVRRNSLTAMEDSSVMDTDELSLQR